jgi:hypothetical protein|tara:strand:- start:247 stop:348 length:102 start_codon:yes stop_codon:yes gene_type:complete
MAARVGEAFLPALGTGFGAGDVGRFNYRKFKKK